MTTNTVHRMGILSRNPMWKLSCWTPDTTVVRLGIARGSWPGEVDQHRPAVCQADEVDCQAPLTEPERRARPGPAPQPVAQDREVAAEVAEVDHRGRRDRDDPGAGELDERDCGQDGDGDARPDGRVQRRRDPR